MGVGPTRESREDKEGKRIEIESETAVGLGPQTKFLFSSSPYRYERIHCIHGCRKGTYVGPSKQIVSFGIRYSHLLIYSEKEIYLGLVDIVYAYCYDLRTNLGESNCESGWTIAKLAATLSCLEVHSSSFNLLLLKF